MIKKCFAKRFAIFVNKINSGRNYFGNDFSKCYDSLKTNFSRPFCLYFKLCFYFLLVIVTLLISVYENISTVVNDFTWFTYKTFYLIYLKNVLFDFHDFHPRHLSFSGDMWLVLKWILSQRNSLPSFFNFESFKVT